MALNFSGRKPLGNMKGKEIKEKKCQLYLPFVKSIKLEIK